LFGIVCSGDSKEIRLDLFFLAKGHLVCIYFADFFLIWQILHLLGSEGPKTADPSKYIRYIYNRVILENATVRASAVSALAKFGVVVETLRVNSHLLPLYTVSVSLEFFGP
jgi:hypothetical protein